MSTNFQKRGKQANQRDALRGQSAMDRLTGVVKHEQRMQAKSGQIAAAFNSQPQAGWKKEWKSGMASKGKGKGNASIGPDTAWTDEQAWLQGSKKCFDARGPKDAGSLTTVSPSTRVWERTKIDGAASASKSARALPTLPVPPEQVSKTAFQKYVAEVNAQVQQALSDTRIQVAADDVQQYMAELAQALRVLTKPASAAQKTQICEAMASVWDMRSNAAPPTGPPLDLRALSEALGTLRKCFSSEEVMPVPVPASEAV